MKVPFKKNKQLKVIMKTKLSFKIKESNNFKKFQL